MADVDALRRIARTLPESVEGDDGLSFGVMNKGKVKGYTWVWLERLDPKKARVPNPSVFAVRVANAIEKDLLLAADERKFFTEPHYNGFPAVLVRLAEVDADELEELLVDAWRCQAPKQLIAELDARSAGS